MTRSLQFKCWLAAVAVIACFSGGVSHAGTLDQTQACQRHGAPGSKVPTPADPYPLPAAGWGPDAGHGLQVSRWVEDWTCVRHAGQAPVLKAMALWPGASLTLNAEARLRYDIYDNAQLNRGNDYRQGLGRGIVGADLRLTRGLRFYAELGTGQVLGRSQSASASLQNVSSLQQALVDLRQDFGSHTAGVMVGRQEFADGPRQLMSVGDGSNLHRTWNGTRLYFHARTYRLGAFDFRATQLGRRSFDEKANRGERLSGLNASILLASEKGANSYLDPFYYHSENSAFSLGGQTGKDDRDTYGARLWGQKGDVRFDWTVARQTGRFRTRTIDAWGAFLVQSVALSGKGWKPRLTSRIDIASGGGTYGTGTVKGFNALYASSNYLGDGRFLSLDNLLLMSPGLTVSPNASTSLSFEYGLARRLNDGDAVYGGGLRAYTGTQGVSGHDIGRLLRLYGSYSVNDHVTIVFNHERFDRGDVLKRVNLPSGSFSYIGSTWRY